MDNLPDFKYLPQVDNNIGGRLSTRTLGFCFSEAEVESKIQADMAETGLPRYKYTVKTYRKVIR